MRHSLALQRKSDGRWDYTTNGCPTGYCLEYVPLNESDGVFSPEMAIAHNKKMLPLIGNYHTDGHATEQEACDCFKKYMLDTQLRLNPAEPPNAEQQNRCGVCRKFTACYAYVGPYAAFVLCPEHQTRECVESLYNVGESWES